MIFEVRVKPGKKEVRVQSVDERTLEVWLTKQAQKGRANEELVRVLRDFFKKPVSIVSGFTSHKKRVRVE
ncbi:hypothetical protein COT72_01080 [archaeon CG10_big_fil_rev_8_21_14_0_10_43_11]|nr:MAG: hypothetical protein COT72_01080 [archaeon CG10_big_fil_rev_8_21_14_0_10_43_11]